MGAAPWAGAGVSRRYAPPRLANALLALRRCFSGAMCDPPRIRRWVQRAVWGARGGAPSSFNRPWVSGSRPSRTASPRAPAVRVGSALVAESLVHFERCHTLPLPFHRPVPDCRTSADLGEATDDANGWLCAHGRQLRDPLDPQAAVGRQVVGGAMGSRNRPTGRNATNDIGGPPRQPQVYACVRRYGPRRCHFSFLRGPRSLLRC